MSFRAPLRRSRRGMALIITLSAVVLMTTVILAFFLRAQLDRQIASAGANFVKSDLLARSALNLVVGDLRDEILDGNRSTANSLAGGAVTLYVPTVTADWAPAPSGLNGATGALLKVSASGVPLRPNGTLLVGSAALTSAASLNGRSWPAARWYTSTTSSPQLGSQGTAPTWLLVTRQNGVANPDITAAKDPTNANYVVGRFAYAVYDTGGLLDASVAGYPTTVSAADAGLRGSAAYADLTVLGPSAANVSDFVSWRNPAASVDAAHYLEWAGGIPRPGGGADSAALAAARTAHRSVALGENAPLTRHELLAASAQFLGNPAAPILLTHFSRNLNTPTFVPATVAAATPDLRTLVYANAGTVPHYNDDGTLVTPTPPVAAGDFVLRRRFSLAKLAWLGPTGPNASAFNPALSAAQQAQAIQDCFGLKWNAGTLRWDYVGSAGTIQSSISTLNTIAAAFREPNFFETLKAGIVPGSLGQAAAKQTLADATVQKPLEQNADLQVLRMGACAIDSADNDNLPTTITLNCTANGVTVATPVYGVEDLPYLYGLCTGLVWSGTYSGPPNKQTVQWMSLIGVPMLFSPHRVPAVASGTAPVSLQIKIVQGQMNLIFPPLNGAAESPAGAFYQAIARGAAPAVVPFSATEANLATRATIPIFTTATGNFRAGLKPVQPADNGQNNLQLVNTVPGYTSAANQTDNAIVFYTYNIAANPVSFVTAGVGAVLQASVSNLVIALQFADAAGNWHTYDTFSGNEAFAAGSGLGGAGAAGTGINAQSDVPYIGFGPNQITDTAGPGGNTSLGWGYFKADPRTTRFGMAMTTFCSGLVTSPLSSGLLSAFVNYVPFSGINPYFPGLWYEGTAGNNAADPDGTTRPADAVLDPNNANPYRAPATSALRPSILQRPFRSVAELGQVFRDAPGKTINFFTSTSGDKELLDLFSVADEPLVTAGRVSLASPQAKTFQALLNGAGQDIDGSTPLASPGPLGTAYVNYAFSGTPAVPTAALPTSVGGLVDFLSAQPLNGATSLDGVKYHREAVVRALAGTTQARTWNLLIDVVAQTGHYLPTSSTLDNFLVEGQRRYWLSIAIDRLTGKIVDQQLEPANE